MGRAGAVPGRAAAVLQGPRLRQLRVHRPAAALEKSSGRELEGWAQEWLQTAGVNTLPPEFELDDDGTYTSFAVAQTAPPDWPDAAPAPARHRPLRRGRRRGCVPSRTYLEIDVDRRAHRGARAGRRAAARPAAAQRRRPRLRQDPARRALARDRRSAASSRLDDSLARALCWGAAWDMTRDAEMSATDFVAPGARQHRHRDRRLGRQPDPGLRRPGGQLASRPRPTGRPSRPRGSAACASCSRRPSRAATTS